MSVYLRGKTWYVEFIVRGQRVKRAAPRTASKSEAKAFERRLRWELDHPGKPPGKTFDEALKRWLAGEARTLRDHSLHSDIKRVRPYIAGRLISEAVECAEEARAGFYAEDLAPATVNRKLGIIRRLCSLAYQWRWEASNHADFIPLERVNNMREQYMSADDVEAFASNVRPECARLIRAAYACGLRLGELERLQPGDLTVDGTVGWLYVAPGKNGRSRRVPILEQDFGLFDPLPFRFSRQQLKDDWDKARVVNGRLHFRFHDTRHGFATRLAKAGAGTAQIAALLGHSDLRTAQRYVSRPDENLLAAVRRVGELQAAAPSEPAPGS